MAAEQATSQVESVSTGDSTDSGNSQSKTVPGTIHIGGPAKASRRKSKSVDTIKVCKVCGADVKGHTRYRNARGEYWCKTCYMLASTKMRQKKRAKTRGIAITGHLIACAIRVNTPFLRNSQASSQTLRKTSYWQWNASSSNGAGS